MKRHAYLLDLREPVPYVEAWELQRSLAGAVSQGAIPDTVVLLEHPPVITLGRRAEEGELHVPASRPRSRSSRPTAAGKSTYHAPGQLVCYPILDLTRHGQDVKKYCRDLEQALIRTLGAARDRGEGDRGPDGPLGRRPPPRKIASIGVHIHKWVTTHGYALNVDLDTAPFTDWITACGLEGASFTTVARELGAARHGGRRPAARGPGAGGRVLARFRASCPPTTGHGLWPQPLHASLARA